MNEMKRVINDLNSTKLILCNPQMLTPEMCVRIGQVINSAIDLLEEQEPVMWTYDGYNCFECSNCGFNINDEVYYITNKPISFCPGCGRKLKLDAKEGGIPCLS